MGNNHIADARKKVRMIDANGSYTLNECNETGHSLCFGGGFIDVYDPKGKHICQFWAGDAPTVDPIHAAGGRYCHECKSWHEGTGWCDKHSHFVDRLGDFCYPEESGDWKDFDADYFCKDGERKDNETV